LEAVGNLIYLAKGIAGMPTSATENLVAAEQELDRVSHITRQTLGFYRESKLPERIEVPEIMEYVLKLYSNKLKAKEIQLERDFNPCPSVRGVAGELKQVLSNLICNAIDAVHQGGMICIRLSCIEDPDGKFVRVVIQDDGPGIPPENLERIFEAFFTTKRDVGTGLGLWVTKEIVERHNGRIHIRQNQGELRGAEFNVLLPCEASDGVQG
jgi:signal transduction histidine kinase